MVSVLCQELWNPATSKCGTLRKSSVYTWVLGFFAFFFSFSFSFLFQNPSQTAPIETAVVLTCLLVAVRKLQAYSNCIDAMESKGSMNGKRRLKKNEKWAHATLEEQSKNFRKISSWGLYFITVWRVTWVSSHTHGHEDMVFNTFYIYKKRTWWILITFIATFSLQNIKMSSDVRWFFFLQICSNDFDLNAVQWPLVNLTIPYSQSQYTTIKISHVQGKAMPWIVFL